MIPKASTGRWCVYLLSSGGRTYIGATTDITRRVRQHNREIVGGARSTRNKKWVLVLYMGMFGTRSEAYRWEKLMKIYGGRGLGPRTFSFQCLAQSRKVQGRNKVFQLPENIILVLEG
jgi:predicted GIY-YIG superfamily endonuclease